MSVKTSKVSKTCQITSKWVGITWGLHGDEKLIKVPEYRGSIEIISVYYRSPKGFLQKSVYVISFILTRYSPVSQKRTWEWRVKKWADEAMRGACVFDNGP